MFLVTPVHADGPIADAGGDVQVEAGNELTFDGSGSTSVNAIESYQWTFQYDGEDKISHKVIMNHTFSVPGTYEVTLTVMDDLGYTDIDTVTVTVVDTTPPVPEILWFVPLQAGDMALWGGDSTDNVGVTNWTWKITFENEITDLHGEDPMFVFHTRGDYLVELTVRDAAGNSNATTATVTVGAAPEDGGGGIPAAWAALITIVILAVVVGVALFLRTKEQS
jgi:PKD repeat protein